MFPINELIFNIYASDYSEISGPSGNLRSFDIAIIISRQSLVGNMLAYWTKLCGSIALPKGLEKHISLSNCLSNNNNTHDVVDFDSPCMIRKRRLQYSVEGCVFALLVVFAFGFFFLLSL